MFRHSKKKVILVLLVSCAIYVGFNIFNGVSTWNIRGAEDNNLDRHEGPPVFLISDSRSHTFLLKQRSITADSWKSQTENTHTTTNMAAKLLVMTTTVTAEIVEKVDINKLNNGSMPPGVTSWCPDIPPVLEGPLADMADDITPTELTLLHPNMEKGGRLKPTECTPRQRLAIIVPYRNRYPHLHIMMNNLIPILERQQADVTFFVIEQAPPETFNRGALLNIGFLEAEKLASFDCYIFHDVDLVPLNDHNFYRCGDNPRHFAVAMNKFRYKLYYTNYFGGVVGFSKQQYLTVNGCSNIYFGWGGEDDDLLARLLNKNYTMTRYDSRTARYNMIKHKRDEGNKENPLRRALRKDSLRRQDVEGLNSVKYTVNSLRQEHLYTWINVSLNRTLILQTAPASTIQIMKNEMKRIQNNQTLKQKVHNTTVTH